MSGISNDIATFVYAIIGGGVGVALVNAVNDRWKLRQQRKAQLEDREEEKNDKTDEIGEQVEEFKAFEKRKNKELEDKIDHLTKDIKTLMEAQKLMYLDKICYLGQKYISEREITFNDRRMFHMMHDMYHDKLNGNGDADYVVHGVDSLPLKLIDKGEVGLDVHHSECDCGGNRSKHLCNYDSNNVIAKK